MPVIERIYVVGNENAGSFKALKKLLRRSPKQVANRIETTGFKYGVEVKVALTHSLDEANSAISEAVTKQYDAIITIGGDGTLIAAEKQLHKLHSKIPLLAYPGGSKDYVGRAAGVPRRVKKLFRALSKDKAQVRKMKSGRFNFLNNEGGLFNLASGIGSNAALFKKRHFGVGGLIGYAPNGPRVLKDAKFIKAASVTVDGRDISLDGVADVIAHKAGPVGGLNFGNKPYDDDSLTLIKVKKSKTPRRSMLKLLGVGLWDTLRGGRASSHEERIEGKKIKIKLHEANDIQAEGDYLGSTEEVTYDINDQETQLITFNGRKTKRWFRHMGEPLTLQRRKSRQQLALAA